MTTPQPTSRLRGGGCGVLVGGLAVAAHGIGGGGAPRSAEIALLLLVSLTAGIFADGRSSNCAGRQRYSPLFRRAAARDTDSAETVWSRAGRCGDVRWSGPSASIVRTASALLGGQWAGHFALSATLDHHGSPLHLPSVTMTAAHCIAAFVCAALILGAERLYLVVSSVIRAVLSNPSARVRRGARWVATVAVVRGARPKGARCPRAPPLFA
ncbi:hypothetical protein [Nocardia sp. NPDC058705]|uniref:hypothetical protein n=1 Tax=Nocardia sp. NPDC058705 TaxID=3346609 RepID=UPI0036A87374